MTHEMKKKILSAYAISYLRFSSVVQGKGDSRTRQNASRDRWLEAHPEIPLKREMNDLGLSAFSGKHVAKGDLGDFLTLCESKDFRAETARRDVYLLVENLDRLSRERILQGIARSTGRDSREWGEGCHPLRWQDLRLEESLDSVWARC